MAERNPSMTFATRAGTVVHINEVENGLACGCSCPSCGERLMAKQGAKTAHHFAHEGGSECTGGVQTALHLAAKVILTREKRMVLPALCVTASASDADGISHRATASLASKQVVFNEISEEVRFGSVIPDILAKVGERMLFVEVAVSHFVDDEKVRRISEVGVATIEIDLSGIADGWDWTSLVDAVVKKADNKIWLFNPKETALIDAARKDAEVKAREANRREVKRKARIALSHEYQRASVPGYQSAIKILEELYDPKRISEERARMNAEGSQIGAWISAVRLLGIQWASPPYFINIEVPNESGFLVDRRVWQAAVFALFVRGNRNKTFSGKTAVQWCLNTFPRRTGFEVLQKHHHLLTSEQMSVVPWASKAVSGYLRELVKRGYLEIVGGRYKIVRHPVI